MKNIKNSNSRSIKWIILLLATAVEILCAVCLVFNFDSLNILPFENKYVWESPSYAVRHGDEIIVIDSSKRNVSIADGNGNITCTIPGESGSSSFSNTNYVTTDGKYVYIADIEYASSGTRIAAESIKKFNSEGDYAETYFSKEYSGNKEDSPAQNGFIRWLGQYEDRVYFIYCDNLTLSVYEITDQGVREIRTMDQTLVPEIWNISYSAYDDTILVATKKGKLYYQSGSVKEFKPYNTDFAGESAVFIDVSAYGENVYAADVISHQVFNVVTGEAVVACEDPLEGMFINRLSAYEGGIAFTDGESVILAADGSGITYSSKLSRYSDKMFGKSILAWISLAVLSLSGVGALTALLVYTLKHSSSRYIRTAFVVTLSVIVSTVVISGMILSDMFSRLNDSTSESLVETASVISSSSSFNGVGDAIGAIKSADDYNSPEYQFVRRYLDAFCDAAYDSGSNMYYTVQRFDENFFYGICDYENTIGTLFPSGYYQDDFYCNVVESGEIAVLSNQADEFGVWTFAVAPIRDSTGEIVSVVELGVNMITEQQQNTDIILSVIVKIAVIILLIVLLLIESTVFADGVSGFRKEKNPDIPYFLRPMVFLTFFASNLSAAFIPQMSQEVFEKSGMGYAGSITSALPMSLQLLATAVAAMLCGKLLEKFPAKPLMLTACAVQIAGYAVIAAGAFSNQYIAFSAGHFISGLGIGITLVAFNTMPDKIEDEGLRTSYYSHLNAGIISGVVIGLSIGSYIADALSYASVFIFSGVVVVGIGILVFISVGKEKTKRSAQSLDKNSADEKFGLGKFLGSAEVLSFVVCVMVPLLIMMYFKDYLFPLYASSEGMSDISISNILLFSGAVSIVFGTVIADWLFKLCGSLGMISISMLITSACLVLFGLFPSTKSAVIAVIVLSLSAGFGLAGQEIYYSSLQAFKRFGAKRAMSVYSIFDNASQTAAPLLMGALLVLGSGRECILLGTAGIILYVVFLLVRRISEKNRRKNNDTISQRR